MALDPLSIVMFGLIAVLIFFLFRNGKKRQAAQQEMQNNLRPGAQVMLQSGIFGTIESVDEEENRVTVRSGDSSIVVHRNAIGQIVTPADAPAESAETGELAPDDDPEFGERVSEIKNDAAEDAAEAEQSSTEAADAAEAEAPKTDEGDAPKA